VDGTQYSRGEAEPGRFGPPAGYDRNNTARRFPVSRSAAVAGATELPVGPVEALRGACSSACHHYGPLVQANSGRHLFGKFTDCCKYAEQSLSDVPGGC
jgi:hypothetical protein